MRRRSDELRDQIEKLQAAVEAGSAHVRNNYLTFLLFGLYLAIIFGSTTHEQLLRETPVTLPILDVGLPLVPFFWVAPALFVLLHFNLLVQLYLLAGKLKRLDGALGKLRDRELESAERARLGIFTFSHMLIGEHQSYARSLPRIMAWTSVVILPVALLMLGQIMFLPYHSAATTWFHRGLVLLDVVLLWFLWSIATDLSGRWRDSLQHFGKPVRDEDPVSTTGKSSSVATALSISSIVLDVDRWPAAIRRLPHLPRYIYRRHISDRKLWRPLLIEEMGAGALMFSLLVVTIPSGFLAWSMDRVIGEEGSLWFARSLVVRETNLVSAWPSQAQIDQYGEGGAWGNFGQPIVLTERDLRYADFLQSNFTRADLRGADLQGADLGGAILQSADLGGADLQGANLRSANLQGANLRLANLKGASLFRANLQVTRVDFADLHAASLFGANLQGANLSLANLQGTVLRSANLQVTNLTDVNLQGADVRAVRLWGARYLETVQWSLSDLRGIDLAPPTAKEIADWRNEAEAISDGDVRERVLAIYDEFERQTSQPWTPTFGDRIERRALFDPWFLDEADDREGWLTPMPFALYEPALAEHLIGLACADDAPEAVAERIGRHAVDHARKPGRTYPPMVAKALLDPDRCPSARNLSDVFRGELRDLLER